MEIERLSMCRICLVENVRMYVVVNKSLQELYEKLTGIPFVTNDARPLLACFFCCTKLKQCCQFQRKCLTAEDLFAVMLDEGYEPNASMQYEDLEYYGGLAKTAVEQISIDDGCQIGDIEIKEEPLTFETEDEFIEVKKEDLSEDIELNHLFDSSADAEIALQQSDSEEYVPLVTFKTEVEVEEVPETQTVRDKERVPVLRIPRLNLRTTELEDTNITKEMKNELLEPKIDRNHKKRKLVEKGLDYRRTLQLEENSPDKKQKKELLKRKFHTLNPVNKLKKPINDQGNLNQVNNIHPGSNTKPYKCDICQRCFKEKFNLKSHMRKHTGPFECKQCKRTFSNKHYLINHIKMHSGKSPYKCNKCQRCFTQISSLKRHIIRIHTDEMPYKCDVCKRSFSTKCHLTRHSIRVHSSEKPYQCVICVSSFSLKEDFNKHVRRHNNKKYYNCDKCQRTFASKGHLKCHVIFKHESDT